MRTEERVTFVELEALKWRGDIAIEATREIIRDMRQHVVDVRRDAATMVRDRRVLR